MRKILFILFVLVSAQAFTQDSLRSFNASRNHITATGMKVLGSWGIANMTVGAIGWAGNNGGSDKYFYQMNTLWGIANTGIAVLGLTNVKRNLGKQPGKAENIKAQKGIEKTSLINGGLDFAYVCTGIFLNARGNSRSNDQLKGYGTSVIMQGAFLLLFDATMYTAQRTNGNKFRNFMDKNALVFDGRSIGLIHTFY